jgi:S1-C subfamily serine protease
MDSQLEQYLRRCCVRIGSSALGTGFFVQPGRVLTCAHVVSDQFPSRAVQLGDTFRAFWLDRPLRATVRRLTDDSYPDLAELDVVTEDGGPVDAPYVRLGTEHQVGDPCYVPAYSERRPSGDAEDLRVGATVDRRSSSESAVAEQPGIKLAFGQIAPGFSGAPVVNRRTAAVCAMVQWTRDPHSNLGGIGLPVSAIERYFPDLVAANAAFHAANRAWDDAWRVVRPDHRGIDFTEERQRHPRLVGRTHMLARLDSD